MFQPKPYTGVPFDYGKKEESPESKYTFQPNVSPDYGPPRSDEDSLTI